MATQAPELSSPSSRIAQPNGQLYLLPQSHSIHGWWPEGNGKKGSQDGEDEEQRQQWREQRGQVCAGAEREGSGHLV